MSEINWGAYCRKYEISRERFFQIADENNLPRAKLTADQSQKLLKAIKAEAKQPDSAPGEQTSLF